jgi:predicted TIM-barrel fold metal-dependent hydrolase
VPNFSTPQQIDIHQHLWTEPLLLALEQRDHPPQARRHGEDWILKSSGEAEYVIGSAESDPLERLAALRAAGVDRAVIAPSSPIGLEDLPVSESIPLLDAHLEGVRNLPSEFLHWAVSSVWRIDPDRLEAQLDAGAVGLALPAGALSAPEGIARIAPLLERLEARGLPLFVHPGPGPYSELAVGEPGQAWWPALTRYVAEMNAAWFAFGSAGRWRHPQLKIVFAMLAGLAPLQHERLQARAGDGVIEIDDPLTFYDTSSYGEEAIASIAAVVGDSQIVFGSDAPMTSVAAVPTDESRRQALLAENPARLLGLAVAR